MDLFTRTNARMMRGLTTLLLVATVMLALPLPTFAQTATGTGTGTATGTATGAATGTATGGASAAGSTNQIALPTDSECSWYAPTTWVGCLWRPLMSGIGSLFLMLGIIALNITGWLFDTLIQWVIVNFGGLIGTSGLGLMGAIETGWTIFRDFSNILIIGIFVFIAIGIILGLKEYGQKRLIANVLIVAVLINFSLLFTKIIIDFSNFTAFVIYKQMASAQGTSVNNLDIAAGFLKPMRITSIADSYGVVRKIADTNSGLTALAYGFIGGLMLCAVAIVLLYGCFLIAARAVLFVILMVSAPLAFATYLIPNFSEGEYGWKGWWKSLINSAVFAPLIMLFLAISLVIINTASKAAAGAGTLGSIISQDPRTLGQDTWKIMFLYILGIGLIYVSLKLASNFAGTISGFNFASAIAAAPVTQTGRFLVGGLGRQIGGRLALNQADAAKKDARESTMNATLATNRAAQLGSHALNLDSQARAARARGDHSAARDLERRAEEARISQKLQESLAHRDVGKAAHAAELAAKKEERAKASFNPMDSALAKAAASGVGLTPGQAGQSTRDAEKKGFAGQVEEKAKHAAAIAEKTKLGDDEKKELREQAEKDVDQQIENRRVARENARAQMEQAKATRDAIKTTRDQLAQQIGQEREKRVDYREAKHSQDSEERSRDRLVQTHADGQQQILERIRSSNNESEKRNLRVEFESRQRAHEIELKAQETRIQAARDNVHRIEQDVEKNVTHEGQTLSQIIARHNEAIALFNNSEKEFTDASNQYNKLEGEREKTVNKVAKDYEGQANKEVINVAEHIGTAEAHPIINKIPGATYVTNVVGQNRAVASEARSQMKKKLGNSARVAEVLKAMNEETGGGGGGAAPAAGGGEHA